MKATVLTSDGGTEPFGILCGVLEGDTLEPLLIILCLDYAISKAIENPRLSFFTTISRRRS